jgi:hypothetical protein
MRSPFFTLLLARPEDHRSRALAPDGSQRRQPVTGNMGSIGSKIGKKAVRQVDGRRSTHKFHVDARVYIERGILSLLPAAVPEQALHEG